MTHNGGADTNDPFARASRLADIAVSNACALTGWRIDYAAGPERPIRAMAVVQSQSTSCASSLSPAAAVPGRAFGLSRDLRISYAASRDELGRALERIGAALRALQ